jgi:peptidase C39-like protein
VQWRGNHEDTLKLVLTPGKVYLVTQQARHSSPRGKVSGGDIIEMEGVWLEPWHGRNGQNGQNGQNRRNPEILIPDRDRAATIARPLSIDPIGPLYDDHDSDDSDDTLSDTVIIAPSARQHVVAPYAPHVKGKSLSSRRSVKAIGIARVFVISLMLYYALSSSLQLSGYAALPLAPFPWAATSNAAAGNVALAALRMDGKMVNRVQPMTQMRRVDLYDSRAQFDQWAGAACSAATLAEVLTSYGLPHMTIGRMIRELGPDISPNWGLLNYNAFNKVAAKYGLRADVYLEQNPLSYKQMLYLTNSLGIPVVVNMRATTGYYRFLSGGHILVMTGGDYNTIRLTDSSLYYMKYLPLNTYNQMARHRNVVIVPKDYHYTLPR